MKKISLILLFTLLASCFLGACADQETPTPETIVVTQMVEGEMVEVVITATPEPEVEVEPVTLDVWYIPLANWGDSLAELVPFFEAQNPDVKIIVRSGGERHRRVYRTEAAGTVGLWLHVVAKAMREDVILRVAAEEADQSPQAVVMLLQDSLILVIPVDVPDNKWISAIPGGLHPIGIECTPPMKWADHRQIPIWHLIIFHIIKPLRPEGGRIEIVDIIFCYEARIP